MKKILALIWALVTGRRECADCGQPVGSLHCNGCHNAPAYCVCVPLDLVPADCEDCGYPLEYCVCGLGYDVSDYYDYVEATR